MCPFTSDPDLLAGTGCLKKMSFTDLSINRSIFFSNFLLRLGRIKRSLVTYMGKYGPTAPNFGYDIWPSS